MQSKQKKILVVDDEPDNVEFLHELVEQEDSTVVATTRWSTGRSCMMVACQTSASLDVFLSGNPRYCENESTGAQTHTS